MRLIIFIELDNSDLYYIIILKAGDTKAGDTNAV